MPSRFAINLLASVAALGVATSAGAQEPGEPDYLDALKNCRAMTDPAARLACFDREVGTMVAATDAGELRIVDRDDITRTRRGLFGFSLPDFGIFGDDDDGPEEESMDMMESTITSVRSIRGDTFIFSIAEGGAVWQISDAPARLATPEVGDSVVFKKASMGSYFIRIDGQIGVKGRRIR